MALLVLLAVAATLGIPVAAHAALPTGNVIQNPGAQEGASSADYFASNPPPSWGDGATQVRYDMDPAGGLDDPRPLGDPGGTPAFFAGGNGAESRSISQSISLAQAAPEIDTGDVVARLAAELGGYADQLDRAAVVATYRLADGTAVGTQAVPAVTRDDRDGQTVLMAREAPTFLVPAGTRSVDVTVNFIFVAGGGATYNDGYADNISLSFSTVADTVIDNPGAEIGPLTSDTVTVATPPAWLATGNVTQHRYAGAGFPDAALSASIGGGGAFFAGGPGNPVSRMQQEVRFDATTRTAIAQGRARARLSALLGGYLTDDDHAQVVLTFARQATEVETLGTLTVGPVTETDRGSLTTLLPRSAEATIPAGTEFAIVEVVFTRQFSVQPTDYNDGYADNVALEIGIDAGPDLDPTPDPSASPSPDPTPDPTASPTPQPVSLVAKPDGPPILPAARFDVASPADRFSLALLNAVRSTNAVNYAWDLTGDGQADVDCGNQPQLLVRPIGVAQRVTLTVAAANGRTSTQQQTIDQAGAQTKSPYANVAFCTSPGGLPIDAADITENGGPPAGCNQVVAFGLIRATGCLTSKRAQELGSLQGQVANAFTTEYRSEPGMQAYLGEAVKAGAIAASALNPLQSGNAGPSNMAWAAAFDFYSTRQPVRINGLDFYPRNGSEITLIPALSQIVAKNVIVKIGTATVRTGSLSLDVNASQGKVDIGEVTLTGPLGEIGGFPFVPRARIVFVSGGRAQLPVYLKPSAASRLTLADGLPPIVPATLMATNERGLHTDAIDTTVPAPMWFGRWDLGRLSTGARGVRFAYADRTQAWNVTGGLRVGTATIEPPTFRGLAFGRGRRSEGTAAGLFLAGSGPEIAPRVRLGNFEATVRPDEAFGTATMRLASSVVATGNLVVRPGERGHATTADLDGDVTLGGYRLGRGVLTTTSTNPEGGWSFRGSGPRTLGHRLTFDGEIAGGGNPVSGRYLLRGGVAGNGIAVTGRACYFEKCGPATVTIDQDLTDVCLHSYGFRVLAAHNGLAAQLPSCTDTGDANRDELISFLVPGAPGDPVKSLIQGVIGRASQTDAPELRGVETVRAEAPAGVLERGLLRFGLPRIAGLRATIYDRAPGFQRELRTVAGRRGTLRIRPVADGRRHEIVARVTVGGIPHPRLFVLASYRVAPPRIGRVAAVRVSRRGEKLTVTWPRVAGAAGYAVVVRERAGAARVFTARRPRITVPAVARSQVGTVGVRAVGRDGLAGAVRSGRFAARAKPVSRFRPLSAFGATSQGGAS